MHKAVSSETLHDIWSFIKSLPAHEEAVVVADKPRRGGRKTKQEALQPAITTPRRGGRGKARTVVTEEIVLKAEPAKEDVPEEKLDDAKSSTAIEEGEMPVHKTTGRGRRAKEDLAETQEAHKEAIPAEKPKRGGRKIKPVTKTVVPHESTEVLDEPITIATETPKKGTTVQEQTLATEVVSEEPEEKPEPTILL